MNIHLLDLANATGISKDCIRQYMSRQEFAHIPLRRGVYYGVEYETIKKLQEIYENRKWGRRKNAFQVLWKM